MGEDMELEKIMELLMLAAGATRRMDTPVKDNEVSEQFLPELTEDEREALKALPEDVLAAIEKFERSVHEGSSPMTAEAGMLFRGDADDNDELRRKLREREDEELDKLEDEDEEAGE